MQAERSDDPAPSGKRRSGKKGPAPWMQPLGSPSPAPPPPGGAARTATDDRPWFEGVEPIVPAEDRRTWYSPPDPDEPDPTVAAARPSAPGDWFEPPEGSEPDPLRATLVIPPPPVEPVTTVTPPTGPVTPPAQAAAPRPPRRSRRTARPRVRRVSRVVRRVDAWSVFKVSVVFYVVVYAVLLVTGVLLWALAVNTGTIDNTENFIEDLFGLDSFTFDGRQLFEASWIIGAVLVVAGTGLNVALAVLFNLISDLVGGVRVTVLEEEVVRRYPVDGQPSRRGNVQNPPGL